MSYNMNHGPPYQNKPASMFTVPPSIPPPPWTAPSPFGENTNSIKQHGVNPYTSQPPPPSLSTQGYPHTRHTRPPFPRMPLPQQHFPATHSLHPCATAPFASAPTHNNWGPPPTFAAAVATIQPSHWTTRPPPPLPRMPYTGPHFPPTQHQPLTHTKPSITIASNDNYFLKAKSCQSEGSAANHVKVANTSLQNQNTCDLASSSHPQHPDVITFKKDQQMVNEWLQKRSINDRNTSKTDDTAVADSTVVKLGAVHRSVAQYRSLLNTLLLSPDDEPHSASIKIQLNELSSQLQDESFRAAVRRAVGHRRRKRQRQRASRHRRKEQWRQLDQHLTHELQCQAAQHRHVNTTETLRREADSVLREVRLKQNEAESLQQLVSALRDLRQHRCNLGEQHGHVTTDTHDDKCAAMFDGLEEMVQSQLDAYMLEERTLQAMLHQHQQQKSIGDDSVSAASAGSSSCDAPNSTGLKTRTPSGNGKVTATSSEQQRQEEAEPGDAALYASYTAADTSAEMLLSRRRGWDAFLNIAGSAVPVGDAAPTSPGALWRHVSPPQHGS